MSSLKITNLKEILDPQARHIFLDDQSMTEAVVICGVEEGYFLVHNKHQSLSIGNRQGYFVASNGRGIVRFEGDCQVFAQKEVKDVPFNIYKISINLNELKIINRREFIRYEFRYPLPILFRHDDQLVEATLINISEGGLRMTVSKKLPTQVVYQFEINLPKEPGIFHFSTDGLVAYCEPEDHPNSFMAGVSFVAPAFSNESEKKAYQNARHDLASWVMSR